MANEILPVSDDELDALMAELEEATGVSAAATPPAKPAAPAPAPEPELSDEDLDGLEVEAETPTPAPAAKPTPTVVEIKLEETSAGSIVMESEDGSTVVLPASLSPHETPADVNVDDELAALEAEIASGGEVAPPATPPWEDPAPVAVAEPEPVVEAAPKPEPVAEAAPAAPAPVVTPKPVSVASATLSAEDEEAIAAATKKKAKASLDYYIDVDAFKAEMQVTETNLDNCMMQQASLRAYHGARAARAEAQASSIKARFDVKEAQLYNFHRKAFVEAGEKATEKAVENAVKTDPKWIAMKIMVIEAESIAAVAKSCVAALSDRRDMVIQLGADRRDESKGQARVMQAQADRESLTSRAVNAARASNG